MEYPRIMPPASTADPAELLAADAPVTDLATAPVVVTPEQDGPGAWAGGPSALLVGDTVYLSTEHRAALLPRVAEDVWLLERVTGADFGEAAERTRRRRG